VNQPEFGRAFVFLVAAYLFLGPALKSFFGVLRVGQAFLPGSSPTK
jgi:hypothetical protein